MSDNKNILTITHQYLPFSMPEEDFVGRGCDQNVVLSLLGFYLSQGCEADGIFVVIGIAESKSKIFEPASAPESALNFFYGI